MAFFSQSRSESSFLSAGVPKAWLFIVTCPSAEMSMRMGVFVVEPGVAGAPLGSAMFSSFSFTCWPALAMKKSMSTNTTSTIGAI